MQYAIKNKEIFRIKNNPANRIYYGSNQDWYSKRWQRMAGCGPCAVANVVHYMNQSTMEPSVQTGITKESYLKLMNEIWEYVTPSLGGVSSTSMLCDGVSQYSKKKYMNIDMEALDIDRNKKKRPEPELVLSFIQEALSNDSPVAFLNLEHGTVSQLESWHWVTIISIDDQQEFDGAIVEILDGGIVKQIDILQWLHTTKLGGGFVRFELN